MRKSSLLLAFVVSTFIQGHAQQIVNFPAADLVLGQANFTNGSASLVPTAAAELNRVSPEWR